MQNRKSDFADPAIFLQSKEISMANKRRGAMRMPGYVSMGVGVALSIATLSMVLTANAEEVGSESGSTLPPGIVWFSKSGLDTEHNKIDDLIAIGGNACNHPLFKPGQCLIERKLRLFLYGISSEPSVIARELRSLGAVCREEDENLDCTYEKHVRARAMKGVVVIDDHDDFFKIRLGVTGRNDARKYYAFVELISTPKK